MGRGDKKTKKGKITKEASEALLDRKELATRKQAFLLLKQFHDDENKLKEPILPLAGVCKRLHWSDKIASARLRPHKERGYIETLANPGDKRKILITPTPEGERQYQEWVQETQNRSGEAMDMTTPGGNVR